MLQMHEKAPKNHENGRFRRAGGSAGLQTSLFQRPAEKPGIARCFLRMQYRMHPTISRWPNQTFYADGLEDDTSTRKRMPVDGFPWPRDSAVALVDVPGQEKERGTSWSNAEEATVVKRTIAAAGMSRTKNICR